MANSSNTDHMSNNEITNSFGYELGQSIGTRLTKPDAKWWKHILNFAKWIGIS